MRELSAREVDEVNGGFFWIVAGMALSGAHACISGIANGQSGWALARSVAFSTAVGAVGGGGLSLAKGFKYAGNTYRSITAGSTAVGVSTATHAANAFGN